MKTRKTMRNILCALSVLILWGNVVSLLLPTDQYGGIIKTIDFSTVLFVVMLLIAVFGERRRDRGHEAESALPGGDEGPVGRIENSRVVDDHHHYGQDLCQIVAAGAPLVQIVHRKAFLAGSDLIVPLIRPRRNRDSYPRKASKRARKNRTLSLAKDCYFNKMGLIDRFY